MSLELARAYVVARGDTSHLRQDLGQAQAIAKDSLGGLMSFVTGKMTMAIGAVGAAMSMFKGIQIAGQLEQNIIAFETLMGSAEDAKSMLADLSDFAAKTPFRMAGIIQAARGLVMFGEKQDQVMDTLNILGNAAAGTSSDFGMLALIFNQVRGVGKLLTQDFRQLSTRGVISLKDIAEYFNVTTEAAQAMLSKGGVSFEDLPGILQNLSSEGGRFYNLMEKQSKSLLGLWSTMQEEFEFLARDTMSPLVPVLKEIQSLIIGLAATFREWLNPETTGVLMSLVVGMGLLRLSVLGLSKAWALIMWNPIIAGVAALVIVATQLGETMRILTGAVVGCVAAWGIFTLNPHLVAFAAMAAAALFVAECMNTVSAAVNKAYEESKKNLREGDAKRKQDLEYLDRLEELSTKNRLNSEEMKEADSILKLLGESYGNLGMKIDEATGKLVGFTEGSKAARKQMAEAAKEDLEAKKIRIEAKLRDLAGQIGSRSLAEVVSKKMLKARTDPLRAESLALSKEWMAIDLRLKAMKEGKGGLIPEKKVGKAPPETVEQKKKIEELKHQHELNKMWNNLEEDKQKREITNINEKYRYEMAVAEVLGQDTAKLKEKMNAELDIARLEHSKETLDKESDELQKRMDEDFGRQQQKQQEAEAMIKSLMTPLEKAREEYDQIMRMNMDNKWKERALDRLKKGLETKTEFVMTGRVGFAEFGQRIQDALLKPDDPAKKTAAETKRTADFLEKLDKEGIAIKNNQLVGTYGGP